ncbi:hypothetical protein RJ55_06701 [Drechmeria coniospora]|nr:hypothetical protein RJ55_06701 [Drechmeria coniospora]
MQDSRRSDAVSLAADSLLQKLDMDHVDLFPCRNLSAELDSVVPYPTVEPHLPDRLDRQRLMSFVRGGVDGRVEDYFHFHRDPYRRGFAMPDGPNLRVSDNKQEIEHPSREETLKANEGTLPVLARLYTAVGQRLRNPNRTSLDPIYSLYCELPEPRMLYLTWQWRNRLLRVMGAPPKRDMESMLRYFALLSDVKNAGLSLRRSHWNFALAFATKYAAWTTSREMESALRLWREMERDANVMGNDVTFNILFDVASKAGNFTLADMIYKEMECRGIEFNRFHHVSLIHYFGLKLDSGGIRAAYREMVEAGEMIDTVVLNCVISGLLKCGEESAADETYDRMKDCHALATDLPQRDYAMNKVVTKVLMMFAKVSRKHPALKEAMQTTVRLAPDLHTYKLLVQHYAIRTGQLAKVARYLDEMKHLKLSVHPTIFLALLKGFYHHGGFPGSDWSEKRLEGVLSALYQARNEHPRGFRVESWLVIWALRAVKKCSSTEVLMQTFDDLSRIWDIKPEGLPFIHAIYDNILRGKDMKSPWGKSGHNDASSAWEG